MLQPSSAQLAKSPLYKLTDGSVDSGDTATKLASENVLRVLRVQTGQENETPTWLTDANALLAGAPIFLARESSQYPAITFNCSSNSAMRHA